MATPSVEELEQVYELLAKAIDEVGVEHEAAFLTKLALVLAERLADPDLVREAVEIAKRDIRE